MSYEFIVGTERLFMQEILRKKYNIFSTKLLKNQKITNNIKASTVGTLNTDSSNIVELISNEYDKIHSRIELQNTEPTTNELTIRYYSNCHDEEEKETHICENLPKNGVIKFTVNMNDCPDDWDQKITISPIGLPIKLDIRAYLVCYLALD